MINKIKVRRLIMKAVNKLSVIQKVAPKKNKTINIKKSALHIEREMFISGWDGFVFQILRLFPVFLLSYPS